MNTNAVEKFEQDSARRRLVLALGRGKSGKTLWSRWLIEKMRARGVNPVAADGDWSAPGLARHDERAVWLTGMAADWWKTVLANGEEFAGRPVVVDFSLDVGLVCKVDPEGTNFAERYAARGFDVTKVVFFAPDIGDVVIFGCVGAGVTAASTLLVMNEGTVGGRRSDRFDAVLAQPAIREAIERGARVAWMPELHLDPDRIREIASFSAFAAAEGDEARTHSLDRHAVRKWLARMDDAFAPFASELALG